MKMSSTIWLPYIFVIRTLFLTALMAAYVSANGQIYFQYDQPNLEVVKRYSPGDRISFRTVQFGDNWINDDILQILPDDNALVFYDRITHLEEITHFRYDRKWARIAGVNLMRFGASWLIMGGVIEGLRRIDAIDTNYEFGTDTAIIGLSSIATGYLTNFLWGKAVKKINERNQVRIIDIRF